MACALIFLGGGLYEALIGSTINVAVMDLQPGARFDGPAFQATSCPQRRLHVGEWINADCATTNPLTRPEAFALQRWRESSLVESGRRGRRSIDWMRNHDDAVAAYCGLITGCRVLAVVPDRFDAGPGPS